MIGMGMAGAVGVHELAQSDLFPTLGDPTIISKTTWAILIVVTGGLGLSLTRLREFEKVGASGLGYTALYLLLAGIGAQADLRAVIEAPVYLAAGVVWIAPSPTPLAPSGVKGEGVTRAAFSVIGTSWIVGRR